MHHLVYKTQSSARPSVAFGPLLLQSSTRGLRAFYLVFALVRLLASPSNIRHPIALGSRRAVSSFFKIFPPSCPSLVFIIYSWSLPSSIQIHSSIGMHLGFQPTNQCFESFIGVPIPKFSFNPQPKFSSAVLSRHFGFAVSGHFFFRSFSFSFILSFLYLIFIIRLFIYIFFGIYFNFW